MHVTLVINNTIKSDKQQKQSLWLLSVLIIETSQFSLWSNTVLKNIDENKIEVVFTLDKKYLAS